MSLDKLLIRLVFSAWAFSASAQAQQMTGADTRPGMDANNVLPDPIAGVVTNETVTAAGQQFYLNFVAGWQDKDLNERYTLSIHETPSRRYGSRVWIEFGQRRVYQSNLPPGHRAIKDISEQAIEIAYQNVVDADVQRLLFREQDLAADEF
jgi:curli production assembly/transport component CsgE